MKKIVSVLIAVLMLSVSVLGAEYAIDTEKTGFDRVADEITIEYSGHNGEYMTVFVYDVTNITGESDTPPWDGVENTPIIGLDQAVGSGEFSIKIKPEFTGDVVVVLGGEYGDSTKILLHIENGIPQEITDAEYDAGGDSAVVENKTITIQQGKKLLNATVSTAGTGKVEYKNKSDATVTLTGDILFDGKGAISAVDNKSVKVEISSSETTKTVGFIETKTVTTQDTEHSMTIRATYGEKTQDTNVSFKFSDLSGAVVFHAYAKDVPADAVLELIPVE